ncbi:MAG: hypothetical protein ORN28_08695 [Rhodoferax sp.]|nr:hypothetical protein [Rhodoferax sp.]
MKSKSSHTTLNYWPGYVDAMFNVVLSVLLIIGLMVVGLLCLNLEVVKSGNAVSQISQLKETLKETEKQTANEQKPLALIGAFLQFQLDKKKQVAAPAPEAEPPETITVAPPPPAPPPPLNTNMPPRQEWWQVGVATTLHNATEEWAYLLSQLKKLDLESQIQSASSRPFSLSFGILQFRPNERQTQDLQAHVSDTSKAQSWLVFTAAPSSNRTLLESGNWRLTSVRKALEAQGIPATRIQHRLIPMNDSLFTGRVVFVMSVEGSP